MSDDILSHGQRLLDQLNRKDCERARMKITTAPLTLTDHDFVTLHNYGGEGEARAAWQAKQAAYMATAQPTPAPAALKTKAAAPETMEEWLQRHGTKSVTGAMLVATANEFIEVLKAQKQRVDTLEQANKDLQSRVLELEAIIASRTVEHADR